MNSTIESQLDHRTIREFTEDSLPQETIDALSDVAMRTATSTGSQAASIIRITDPELKREIAKICNQDYINRIPEFWVFIVDGFRNNRIAEEQGVKDNVTANTDTLMQALIDASIMAQNVQVAAESLGLGVAFFGSIHCDTAKLIQFLKLPKYTLPVVGLGFGYPNQEPQQKPRLDKSLRIFNNKYTVFDSYTDEIKDYDSVMTSYYDLRDTNRRSDTFSNIIAKRLGAPGYKSIIAEVIRSQGFDL